MRLRPFRIGVGDQRARLAQPEASLPKQPLALTHAPAHLKAPLDPGTQSFPIPQRAAQADVARGAALHLLHRLPSRVIQPAGAPGTFAFHPSGQASFFKAPNPILHRSGRVPQPSARLRAGHALGDQRHPVEPMLIAGFFRTTNLVRKSQNDSCGLGNSEWSHALMKPQFFEMRNYL